MENCIILNIEIFFRRIIFLNGDFLWCTLIDIICVDIGDFEFGCYFVDFPGVSEGYFEQTNLNVYHDILNN